MNRPENSREALRAFIDYWVPTYSLQHGRKRENLYASYNNDITVLHGFLNAYAEADVADRTWREMARSHGSVSVLVTQEIGRVHDVIALPLMLRLDPLSEEAAKWARLFVPFHEGENSEYLLKSRPVVAARRFHMNGVPPEFAAVFYEPEMTSAQMDRIIELHRTGIAYEYALTLRDQNMLGWDS